MFSILFVIVILIISYLNRKIFVISLNYKKVAIILLAIFIFIDYKVISSTIGNRNNNKKTTGRWKILKVKDTGNEYYYEEDQFYDTVKKEYYSIESNEIYVYCDSTQVKNNDYDFSNRIIKREVQSLGFLNYSLVDDILKVPKQSTLLLFLSSPSKSNTTYLKELNILIGYNNYIDQENITDNYGNPSKLKTFSRVYILGRTNEFSSFHMDLDLFLPSQRQYKIIEHPIRYMEVGHISLFVKLASLNPSSNISKTLMKIERQQFPLDRYSSRDEEGSIIIKTPTDQQCKSEKSFVAALEDWGMMSVIHLNTYMLMLAGFSSRMYIMQQGKFGYGSYNHLFLPVSICDFYDYERDELLKYQISTLTDPKKYKDQIIFNGISYGGFFKNFIPKEKFELFKSTLAINSFLLDYLSTPNFQLREYVNQEITQTFNLPYGMPKRCISVHIRHGDKGSEAYLFPFKEYIEILTAINSGITDVFILSDDKQVIDESIALNKKGTSPFKFYSLPNIVRGENKARSELHFDTNIPTSQYAYQFYAEAIIAARCEIFVGTMSSNIGRLITELQPIYEPFGNTPLKYISLDLPYPQDMSKIPLVKYEFEIPPDEVNNI